MTDDSNPDGPKGSGPTSTTLSSADRFDLNANDTRKILVYEYRGVPTSVKKSSQQELCRTLDKGADFMNRAAFQSPPTIYSVICLTDFTDPRLWCSKLPIPRGKSRLQIHQEDLYPNLLKERHEYIELPNAKNNVALILIPRLVYWTHLLSGRYKNLYITSLSSPHNGPNSIRGSSMRAGQSKK